MKPVTLTLDDLAFRFDELMTEPRPKAAGFSIGRGKKLYWYITPYPKSCLYRCLPLEPDGELGYPRWCSPHQVVAVHYYETGYSKKDSICPYCEGKFKCAMCGGNGPLKKGKPNDLQHRFKNL